MTAKISGGCACGAVRYEIAADPQFQGQCQCRDCQRATGTGHADGLGFPENAVALVGTLSFYEAIGGRAKPSAAASVQNADRQYCRNSQRIPALL